MAQQHHHQRPPSRHALEWLAVGNDVGTAKASPCIPTSRPSTAHQHSLPPQPIQQATSQHQQGLRHATAPSISAASSDQLLAQFRKSLISPMGVPTSFIGAAPTQTEYRKNFSRGNVQCSSSSLDFRPRTAVPQPTLMPAKPFNKHPGTGSGQRNTSATTTSRPGTAVGPSLNKPYKPGSIWVPPTVTAAPATTNSNPTTPTTRVPVTTTPQAPLALPRPSSSAHRPVTSNPITHSMPTQLPSPMPQLLPQPQTNNRHISTNSSQEAITTTTTTTTTNSHAPNFRTFQHTSFTSNNTHQPTSPHPPHNHVRNTQHTQHHPQHSPLTQHGNAAPSTSTTPGMRSWSAEQPTAAAAAAAATAGKAATSSWQQLPSDGGVNRPGYGGSRGCALSDQGVPSRYVGGGTGHVRDGVSSPVSTRPLTALSASSQWSVAVQTVWPGNKPPPPPHQQQQQQQTAGLQTESGQGSSSVFGAKRVQNVVTSRSKMEALLHDSYGSVQSVQGGVDDGGFMQSSLLPGQMTPLPFPRAPQGDDDDDDLASIDIVHGDPLKGTQGRGRGGSRPTTSASALLQELEETLVAAAAAAAATGSSKARGTGRQSHASGSTGGAGASRGSAGAMGYARTGQLPPPGVSSAVHSRQGGITSGRSNGNNSIGGGSVSGRSVGLSVGRSVGLSGSGGGASGRSGGLSEARILPSPLHQAAPMVLVVDNMLESTPEVIEMEMERMSLDDLRELNRLVDASRGGDRTRGDVP